MNTTNSQAVLITATTNEVDVVKQYLLVTHNNANYAWTRTTNGGRGETNAWFDNNYQEVVSNALNNASQNSFVVGDVLSSPLTDVDVFAIENNERPIVLIQKLTKQFNNRQKTISNQLVQDAISDVDLLIQSNPQQLSKYRADGRKEKITMTTNNEQQVATPIIQVVRQEPIAPTSDVIGDYVISVPTENEVAHYIPRKLAGDVSEQAVYLNAKKNHYNILLEGSAGTGKTTSPMYFGYTQNQGVYIVSCSVGIEVGHFVGKTIIKPNGEAGWVDGVLTQAMKHGDILVLDEIDFAPTKILQRLQDVLQNRTLSLIENGGEVVKAHPDFMIVATYNRTYKGSNKLNEALLDRFKVKQYFDYDTEIEKQLIKSPTLLELANKMRADSIQGIYSTPISLRLLLAFQSLSTELNYEFAADNFLMNFIPEERSSVKLLLEAHRFQLEQELTGKVSA